jgi:hypothetical protein
VDHELCRQVISARQFGVAGPAATQPAALGKELGAGGAMNGTINATTAQQGFVGGVDDGINLQRGDVGLDRD